MSFLKKLFGGGGDTGSESAKQQAAIEHEGYSIVSTPMKEGGQFRLAGIISIEVNGEVKSHNLIRADLFTSADECTEACFRKAKLVIKEQGERLLQ